MIKLQKIPFIFFLFVVIIPLGSSIVLYVLNINVELLEIAATPVLYFSDIFFTIKDAFLNYGEYSPQAKSITLIDITIVIIFYIAIMFYIAKIIDRLLKIKKH